MANQPESRLQKKIQRVLKKEIGGWWVKFWGGPFTKAGVPDLLGCVEGVFFALEIKLDKKSSQPSKVQEETIQDILDQGGYASVIRSPEEAIEFVKQSLKDHKHAIQTRAMASTRESSKIRSGKSRRRIVLRTKSRQDLHNNGRTEVSSRRSRKPQNG